jgi:hypothetical protein
MLMTESPKQAVHHAHGRELKTSRAHGHCQKLETSSSSYLWPTVQNKQLISSHRVMALAFMAGLNKIMKDDEII